MPRTRCAAEGSRPRRRPAGTRLSAMRTMPSALRSTWLRTRPTGAATSIDGCVCRSSTEWKKSTPASKCCHGCARLMWSTRSMRASSSPDGAPNSRTHPGSESPSAPKKISDPSGARTPTSGSSPALSSRWTCGAKSSVARRSATSVVADRESDPRHGRLGTVRLRTTEDDARGALRPEFDALRAVRSVRAEAELLQQRAHGVRRLRPQLHVVHVGGRLDGGQREPPTSARRDRPPTRPASPRPRSRAIAASGARRSPSRAGPTGGTCR